MKLIHWFHHLLNPHCQDCKDDINDSKVCESCETLKMQLAIANTEKRIMLESLLEKPKVGDVITRPANLEDLKPRQMTWNVRRQMLEAEDRKAAELLRKNQTQTSQPANKEQAESIEKLEKELGVEEKDAKSADIHGQNRAG